MYHIQLCNLCITFNFVSVSVYRYITFDVFYDRLAPYVWAATSQNKRRFIAWHNTEVQNRAAQRGAVQCKMFK